MLVVLEAMKPGLIAETPAPAAPGAQEDEPEE
jgi:hypothetical protein